MQFVVIPVCAQPTLPNLSSRPDVEVLSQEVVQREAGLNDQPDTPLLSTQPIDPTPNVDLGAMPSDTSGSDVEIWRGTRLRKPRVMLRLIMKESPMGILRCNEGGIFLWNL